jgi:hypothetical protein
MLNPCVIESNGDLRRDNMPPNKPQQPASAPSGGSRLR